MGTRTALIQEENMKKAIRGVSAALVTWAGLMGCTGEVLSDAEQLEVTTEAVVEQLRECEANIRSCLEAAEPGADSAACREAFQACMEAVDPASIGGGAGERPEIGERPEAGQPAERPEPPTTPERPELPEGSDAGQSGERPETPADGVTGCTEALQACIQAGTALPSCAEEARSCVEAVRIDVCEAGQQHCQDLGLPSQACDGIGNACR
jgi:hypothetical protein